MSDIVGSWHRIDSGLRFEVISFAADGLVGSLNRTVWTLCPIFTLRFKRETNESFVIALPLARASTFPEIVV
jgi:hypothetical protein